MHVVRSLQSIQLPASACAIGMFDGVHVGHRMVLENALREARILSETTGRKTPSVVFSFANHPQTLVSQTPTQLLSSLEERLASFEAMGFDYALILDFDAWLMNLPATEFISLVLQHHLGVKSVTVGYDHRFGKNRAGDGDMLCAAGEATGFNVEIIEPICIAGGQIVSSTLIRKLLSYGDLQQANVMLGRPYDLAGPVEQGLQRGRQLGFPTANLQLPPHRLIPATGTYGGYAELMGKRYQAVCNIGLSPTFGDQTTKRVEVHLLGYEGDAFYGETLTMHFTDRIRDEQKFPGIEALIAQIQTDCRYVRERLSLA